MNAQLPPTVIMPIDLRKEVVGVGSTVHVHCLNVAWVLANLTARLKCVVMSGHERILEVKDSSGISFNQAIELIENQQNDAIVIHHCVDANLGGITMQRADKDFWVIDVLPEVSENALDGVVKKVNHIGRELFVTAKYATEWKDDPEALNYFQITYRQPAYYHPRYDSGFDSKFFSGE